MRNPVLDEAGIKITRRNINNLTYANDTTHMAESREELKSLLMRGDAKTGLKLIQNTLHKNILNIHGIWSHRIMAYR